MEQKRNLLSSLQSVHKRESGETPKSRNDPPFCYLFPLFDQTKQELQYNLHSNSLYSISLSPFHLLRNQALGSKELGLRLGRRILDRFINPKDLAKVVLLHAKVNL